VIFLKWKFYDDRPIFQQLYEQLARRIVTGYWSPGERIPPVRRLAEEAGVNPNTMQRALAQLEETGLADANRTSGRTVTMDEKRIAELRESLAAQAAGEYLSAVKALGYSVSEAAKLLEEAEKK